MRTRFRLFTLCGFGRVASTINAIPWSDVAAFVGLVLCIVALLLLAGCSSPVGASAVPCTTDAECHALNPGVCTSAQPYCFAPQHHNIPATFVGHESGPVIWLCATQPRTYLRPVDARNPMELVRTTEEDHYLQYAPCPAVPIS